MVRGLFQDIRFGFRQLLRKPGVPLLIVLLLTLGIGVNTAIFSVVKAVVLETEAPLADRLWYTVYCGPLRRLQLRHRQTRLRCSHRLPIITANLNSHTNGRQWLTY